MSIVVVLGFVGLLFLGSRVLPGPVVQGAKSHAGCPQYRLNGMKLFLLSVVMAGAAWIWAPHLLAYPARNSGELLVAANVFAFALATALYVRGRRGSPPGRRSSPARALVDYVRGVELNPAWGGVDLKLFSYRPSLIALFLFNVSYLAAQYLDGGSVSGRMALYQVFFFIYIANYFQFEGGMIYTWDILAERFGWMLVWGDFVLVPFFYSLPGRTLVGVHEPLALWAGISCTLLFLTGFWLFRGANEQKHRFKQDRGITIWGRPAETVGGKLLVSGFWGLGRKLNYTGELLVYTSWTVLCGTTSLAPYLVLVFLAGLFVHRAHRDDKRCRAKYGAVWLEYCRRARFRMVPFLY
ncbi:DUF1295 domain-containing protein [Streptomyces sp. G44]|uniref:DUF1295 domain-containing protein n=1 Tax=Streptomyces sp. G44 TaxID=2807632 RepID=UPI00195FA980|nr:DUF1295 domain-containing protein [Streptomyces sp. G44]MBM7166860.1 DUF1295 domain-containing protein [Streptomyces sp. G44]